MKVVHVRRDEYDVYVGRPTKWGNPFRLESEGQRAQVIADYEKWLDTQPELLAALPELRGKVLACWCAPKACHADVLLRRANVGADRPAPEEPGTR